VYRFRTLPLIDQQDKLLRSYCEPNPVRVHLKAGEP
jgi:hypothetical protein